MRHALPAIAPALAALLGLSACDQPKWREPPPAKAASGTPVKNKVETVGTPAAPAWVQPLLGKNLRAAFPKSGICKGNTDIVQKRYTGQPAGVQLHGWGWDTARNARLDRVVLVDATFRIVGGGEGGISRTDVPTAVPEITDPNTGWNADLPLTKGPLDGYGVTGPDSVCVLGHIEF